MPSAPPVIETPDAAAPVRDALASEDRIALDLEAAGFHRYSDRLTLIQLSTPRSTWILDPLAFDPAPVLREPLESERTEVLMHGADFDVRLLSRDLDLRIRGLFDTQVAAQLLGERAIGLQSLLEKYLGVHLAKKFQRADWARRPLPDEMLAYAAADTRHLHDLAAILREKLEEAGRLEWALEECRALEQVRWEEPDDEDLVVRVKDTRDLDDRQIHALRTALEWRDEIAREWDRAHFRVVGDDALLEVVRQRPWRTDDLKDIRGMSSRLAGEHGEELLDRLAEVADLPASEVEGYPPPPRVGPGRPTPEEEALASRLKSVRNRRADELGLDRGVLMPNATLLEVARAHPRDRDALLGVPEVRQWQVEAMGEGLLEVLTS